MNVEIRQLREDLKENLFEIKIEKYYSRSQKSDEMVLYLTFGELTDLKIVIANILNKVERVDQ